MRSASSWLVPFHGLPAPASCGAADMGAAARYWASPCPLLFSSPSEPRADTWGWVMGAQEGMGATR